MRKLVALLAFSALPAIMLFAEEPAVVAPNDALVVDGVPPVPRAIAERANQYTESRGAAVLDWHPVRREILMSTRFADTNQVHSIKMPGGARKQLTFFPDRVSGAKFQPHKGTFFVFSKDVGGGEWFQLYRYDVSSGETSLLTDGASRNTGSAWSNAGDRIAYGSTRRNRSDVDFYVMNPEDKSTDRMIAENKGGGWVVVDWSPDDRTLLAAEFISANESNAWLVDAASGRRTRLTPTSGDKVAWRPIGFTADGKGVYLTGDRDGEFQQLGRMDLAGAGVRWLTHFRWDVDSTALSPDRRRVAMEVNENGVSVLHVLDLETGGELPLPAVPAGTIGGLTWHENNRDLAFTVNSARSPSDIYSIDLSSGKLDRWTENETGGLDPGKFVEPELVRWKSFDGLEITGFLYRPPARFTGRRPVIVDIHGGPEGQARPTFRGRSNYYINEMGIAMIFPNVRGSSGYGKTFIALDNGFRRESSYRDIEALLNWIKSRPDLDGDRILITGGSYGGHMTLAVATRYDRMICCSVDVVGMSNLRTFLENTEAYRRDLRRVEYGDERDPKMREFLERIAPMNHVREITKPMFVVQGQNDPRVPHSEADQMVAALKAQKTPVWYLVARDEGHGFAKKKNADFQFYSTIVFLRRYLLGESTTEAGANSSRGRSVSRVSGTSGVQPAHHGVVRDAGDAEHVRGDPEAHVVLLGHRADVVERLDHDVLEPLVDLLLAPEEARAILNPLEV